MPQHSLVLYLQLCAHVGAGCCLSVNSALKAQQQAKDMLRHLSAQVTQQLSLFNCCQVGPEREAPWQVGKD